jgi:hypothetical protein
MNSIVNFPTSVSFYKSMHVSSLPCTVRKFCLSKFIDDESSISAARSVEYRMKFPSLIERLWFLSSVVNTKLLSSAKAVCIFSRFLTMTGRSLLRKGAFQSGNDVTSR